MTSAELFNFMARHKLGVLGTIEPKGTPQSALVGIAVTPKLDIIFDTVKSSRKYPNLLAHPTCSFVIGMEGAQTVQYEGIATELAGAELAHYQPLYFEAWPDGPLRLSWEGIVYFVVHPTWIRFSDFAQTPPLIVEFPLGHCAH